MTPRQPATDLWTLCAHTACGVRLGRRALRTPNTWLVPAEPDVGAAHTRWVARIPVWASDIEGGGPTDPADDIAASPPTGALAWPCQRGATGPFQLDAGADDTLRDELVRVPALRRQACPRDLPLPQLERLTTAAGRPCAIWQWVEGEVLPDPRQLDDTSVVRVARALARLHAGYGTHGDLRPEHVVWTAAGPIFVDPLANLVERGVGPMGWTLPVRWNHPTLADVASLVQWVAVAHGARLPWDAAFVNAILNLDNGRFAPRSRSPWRSAPKASAHGAVLEGVHAPAARWAAATLGPLYAAVLGERAPWTAQDTTAALAGLVG